jgi:hypothetical protein
MERPVFKRSRFLVIIPLFAALLLILPAAQAHQPRLVMGKDIHEEKTAYPVVNPQISKAFYGELTGKPDYYKFTIQDTTDVYFGILVPDVTGDDRTAMSMEVYFYHDSSKTQVILFEGARAEWKLMYEDFGGDWYIMGPQEKLNLTAGTYYIKVFNQQNLGKYSLAVGDMESFPPLEMLNAYMTLPLVKQQFFGKPVLLTFFHYLGIILAMGTMAAGTAILFTSRRNSQRAAWAYGSFSYATWLGFLTAGVTLFLTIIQNPLNLINSLRTIILVLIFMLFLSMDGRIHSMDQDRSIKAPKLRLSLSMLLWLIFLFFTACAV